jgi:hypothetical protein
MGQDLLHGRSELFLRAEKPYQKLEQVMGHGKYPLKELLNFLDSFDYIVGCLGILGRLLLIQIKQ